MGNKVCCEGFAEGSNQDRIVIQVSKNNTKLNALGEKQKQDAINLYPLSDKLKANMERLNPFAQKIDNLKPLIRYGDQIYQGNIDKEGRPDGLGKMYYKNGSVFVGQFKNGKAFGSAYYFWPDGSYYIGLMSNNKANDKNGMYKCQSFKYEGSFIENQMTGEGEQSGDSYTYTGLFQNGQRKKGKLVWKEYLQKNDQRIQSQFQYVGQFDKNGNFTGEGTLTTPKGIYKGSFKDGKKNGFGKFQNNAGLRYEGTYKNDIKQGEGTIYLKSNHIAYSGQMANGLPHGNGWVLDVNGSKNNLKWDQGISSIIVSQQEAQEWLKNFAD